MIDQISIPLGSKSLEIQIGKLAKQADGAAVVRYGDTVVLATAVFAKEPKENAEFFPLTVDYRETTYAAGRIPGGWFKREGRPTEKEILTSRLIDRPMPPALSQGLQPRDADRSRSSSPPTARTTPTSSRINGASVALTCSLDPLLHARRRRARRAARRQVRPEPDQRRARQVRPRPDRLRHRRRGRHGRGRAPARSPSRP